MKRLLLIVGLLLICRVSVSQQVDTVSCSLSVTSDGDRYAQLLWTAVDGNPSYKVCRRLPGAQIFDTISVTSNTSYIDYIPHVVCDTVFYHIETRVGETLYVSNRSGDIVYDNSHPTTGCEYGVATVDSISQNIVLRWQASPDEDIWGYYLCSGDPCMDYDTVWGRLSTSYECLDFQSTNKHIFRVLAFDSCLQASPLTPPFNNIVLAANAPPCSNTVNLSWNRYINMPDSVGLYRILMKSTLDAESFSEVATVGAQGPYSCSIPLDGTEHHICVKVVAENTTSAIRSESNIVCLEIEQPDTALFVSIQQAEYDEAEHSVQLWFSVDADFYAENGYTLYRGVNNQPMRPLANLPYTGQSFLNYTDSQIGVSDSILAYSLSVEDGCLTNEKFSDTVVLVIDPADPANLYFPNVFTPDENTNNRFCPVYEPIPIVEYSMDIFSRNGLLVFHSDNIDQCWDGNSNDGVPLTQGVYVYRVYCKVGSQRVSTYFGNVLLLR